MAVMLIRDNDGDYGADNDVMGLAMMVLSLAMMMMMTKKKIR